MSRVGRQRSSGGGRGGGESFRNARQNAITRNAASAASEDTHMSDRPAPVPAATPKYVIDQLISAKAIAARVEALAREITQHFKGTDKLVVVGLLRGSFVFIADLVREIELPVEVDFLEASSYGDAMQSSREVRILKDLRGEIAGRDVLVVEDIVDTGFTLHHVIHLLKAREPARLKVCALLDKPSRREVPVKADWTGFEIPDEFVVGYGIDFAQRNRNLPYIGKVRFTGGEA
jgi:hypoxanthine phosphoribosyltransferase